MDEQVTWNVDGVSAETVLTWARSVSEGAYPFGVSLTRPTEHGTRTFEGRAVPLHYNVTGVGAFTLVLWQNDERGRPDYRVREVQGPVTTPMADPGDFNPDAPVTLLPDAPRPRLRTVHVGGKTLLVLDQWTGPEARVDGAPELAEQGIHVVAFDRTIDIPDVDAETADEIAERAAERAGGSTRQNYVDQVLGFARDLAELHDKGLDTSAAQVHLSRAVDLLNRYDGKVS